MNIEIRRSFEEKIQLCLENLENQVVIYGADMRRHYLVGYL